MDDDTLRDWSDKRLLAPILGARLADRLIRHFGDLHQLLLVDSDEVMSCHGIGRAKADAIRALPELARRYYAGSLPTGEVIRNPTDTAGYLQARMRHLQHELFCCLFLDNRHRVIRFDEMFRGTIDGTSVYPREVVKEALAVNAAAVILAHNHPSGVAEPSQADERITRRLKSALDLVDIRLLDHLIIGNGEATSLAARGML